MNWGTLFDADPVREHHQGTMPFFVYGTLMWEWGAADRWIDQVDRVERRLLVTGYNLWVTHGNFPFAVKADNPDHYVFGELLWPSSDKAAGILTERFDRIEGHPNFYYRTEVTVTRTSQSKQQAWMYTMPKEDLLRDAWGVSPASIGPSWRAWKSANPSSRWGAQTVSP